MSNKYFIILILALSIWLCACKKYPENTVWFKNPSDIPVIQGYITAYVVNGIDSLDLLNTYYAPVQPLLASPYNNIIRDIKREFFNTYISNGDQIGCDVGTGHYKWSDNKKKISIFFYQDIEYYKKNLFINKETIDWDIIYLDKKKSKIKTTYNDNTYEITFEN